MVVHDVLIKRKVSLDHIRQGLEILNVLEAIKDHPHAMRCSFTENGSFDVEDVIKHIELKSADEEQTSAFLDVLRSFDNALLKKFCCFVTGAESFAIGQRLSVRFANTSSIASSTCALDLILPLTLSRDTALLRPALVAVIDSTYRRNFNTM